MNPIIITCKGEWPGLGKIYHLALGSCPSDQTTIIVKPSEDLFSKIEATAKKFSFNISRQEIEAALLWANRKEIEPC